MGNNKIARVVVVGESGESEGMGGGGVYKYVWKKEQVVIENFVEDEFRLRPRREG